MVCGTVGSRKCLTSFEALPCNNKYSRIEKIVFIILTENVLLPSLTKKLFFFIFRNEGDISESLSLLFLYFSGHFPILHADVALFRTKKHEPKQRNIYCITSVIFLLFNFVVTNLYSLSKIFTYFRVLHLFFLHRLHVQMSPSFIESFTLELGKNVMKGTEYFCRSKKMSYYNRGEQHYGQQ
jgi:hypothetical protein